MIPSQMGFFSHDAQRCLLSIHVVGRVHFTKPKTDDHKSPFKNDFVCDINITDVTSPVLAAASCVCRHLPTPAAEADKPRGALSSIQHQASGLSSVSLLK